MSKRRVLVLAAVAFVLAACLVPVLVADERQTARKDEEKWQERQERNRQLIELMREEIVAEGYAFSVGDNPAMQYELSELCGVNPELEDPEMLDEYTLETPDGQLLPPMDGRGKVTALPASFTGSYTPIKNQGSCGSCWAFAAAGSYEGNLKRKKGVTVNLSEQFLLCCNPNGYGCNGGWSTVATMYTNAGSPYESCYPYTGSKSSCYNGCAKYYPATGTYYVGPSSGMPTVTAIKNAIYNYGSVAGYICADSYFQAYTGGIFSRNNSGYINHAIILCGWNDSYQAWLLKNSWGTGWGQSGFMWIKYNTSSVGNGALYTIPK